MLWYYPSHGSDFAGLQGRPRKNVTGGTGADITVLLPAQGWSLTFAKYTAFGRDVRGARIKPRWRSISKNSLVGRCLLNLTRREFRKTYRYGWTTLRGGWRRPAEKIDERYLCLAIVSEISWKYCCMQHYDVVCRDCREPQENTELSKSVVLNFAAPFLVGLD